MHTTSLVSRQSLLGDHDRTVVINLAFSTNAFKRFSLGHAISSIAHCGYVGVEILADMPHAYPPAFSEDQITSTRKQLSELRITISNLNAFTLYAIGDVYHPSWIDPDERKRRQRLEHTLNCITLAKKLGISHLSTEPGGPISNDPKMSRATQQRIFLNSIQNAVKIAEKEGIKILIEPEPGLLIQSSSEFLNFIKDIPSEFIGLNFDIGHFFCVREDPVDLVSKLAEHIVHFHIEDISAGREHTHLIPGLGAIDFRRIFHAIDQIGYNGFVTVELYPYQDDPGSAAKSAIEYLSRTIR